MYVCSNSQLKYTEIVNCDIIDGYFNVANEFGVKLIKVSESHEIRLRMAFLTFMTPPIKCSRIVSISINLYYFHYLLHIISYIYKKQF
jgi:hypothetical protein